MAWEDLGAGFCVDLWAVGGVGAIDEDGQVSLTGGADHAEGVLPVLREAHLGEEVEVVFDDGDEAGTVACDGFVEAGLRGFEGGIE